jgi:hypothetical protein
MAADSRKKQIEQKLIEAALEVCKKGEGGLFVLGEGIDYTKMLTQKIHQFNVLDPGAVKTLVGLGIVDGAVIINKNGDVLDYGAMINSTATFTGHGTRHAAGLSGSKNNNTSVLASEEERKVKIFKNGKYVMQIDALEKGIEQDTDQIATMLETIGAGFVGTLGVTTLAPAIGVTLLPGVLIFGGSYYAIKSLLKKFGIN